MRSKGPPETVTSSGAHHLLLQAGIGSGNGLAVSTKVWKVSTAGILSTFAGTGMPSYSGDGGTATAAQLAVRRRGCGRRHVAVLPMTQNQRVRCVAFRAISTLLAPAHGRFQWRNRIAAHGAAQSSARARGGRSGQLVCGGHGEQPHPQGATCGNPHHHGNGNASISGDGGPQPWGA